MAQVERYQGVTRALPPGICVEVQAANATDCTIFIIGPLPPLQLRLQAFRRKCSQCEALKCSRSFLFRLKIFNALGDAASKIIKRPLPGGIETGLIKSSPKCTHVIPCPAEAVPQCATPKTLRSNVNPADWTATGRHAAKQRVLMSTQTAFKAFKVMERCSMDFQTNSLKIACHFLLPFNLKLWQLSSI